MGQCPSEAFLAGEPTLPLGDSNALVGLVILLVSIRRSGQRDRLRVHQGRAPRPGQRPAHAPVQVPELVRPTIFVPEAKQVGRLFREMRSQHMQMVIVIDEHGGTAGMVTLEELVEEIVGRLTEEWVTEPLLVQIDQHTVQVHGLVRIDEVDRELGIALPEDAHYDTIAGFVLCRLRRIPEEGEHLSYGGIQLTVLEMKGPKIEKVLLKRS